jgi:hypothetical protein
MSPNERAIRGNSFDPYGLIFVAKDLCVAASVAFAARAFSLCHALVGDAAEVLEIRSAELARAPASRRSSGTPAPC